MVLDASDNYLENYGQKRRKAQKFKHVRSFFTHENEMKTEMKATMQTRNNQ